jgi:hypothetical protein
MTSAGLYLVFVLITGLGLYALFFESSIRLLRQHPRLVVGLVAAILTLAYAYARHRLVPFQADTARQAVLLTGDEPDYLLGALSLARDGDIDVANNIANQDCLIFQKRPGRGWKFDYFNRIAEGRIEARRAEWGGSRYSQHRPGTMAFLAPVFRLTDCRVRWWSYTMISMWTVLFAVVFCLLSRREGLATPFTAALALVFLLAPPVFFYANQAYPEVPAATLIATAFLLSIRSRPRYGPYSAALLICAAVWFSDRILPAAGTLGFFLLYTGRNWRQRVALAAILTTGAALFAGYCLHRFGVPYPISHDATYGFSVLRLPIRFLQIFFDRKQGWAWLFPVSLLMPFIVWKVVRDPARRREGIVAVLLPLLSLALIASFNDWQGGTNPRGRFYAIPQILFLCPVLLACAGSTHKERRPLALALSALSALALAQLPWLARHPNWWFREYHPFFGLAAIQGFYEWLPDLSDNAPLREWIKLALWAPLLALPSLWAGRYTGAQTECEIRESETQRGDAAPHEKEIR